MSSLYSIMVEELAVMDSAEDEFVPRALRPLTDTEVEDDVLRLSCVVSVDREEEPVSILIHGDEMAYLDAEGVRVNPVDTSCMSAYWTQSGDNPVLKSEAEVVDENRSQGGWSDAEPEYIPNFYSAAKPECHTQFRNYNTVCVWIWKNRENPEKLRAGWKRFWKRYFQLRESDSVNSWLMPWHVTRIRAEFARHGIRSTSK